MAKSGQARVLTEEQIVELLSEIEKKRHPEKNSAIMLISFKLGLRVQEIALLQIKEVASLMPALSGQHRGYKLLDVMALPAAYTKGANAVIESKSEYVRQSIRFRVSEFDKIVKQIASLAKAGVEINPSDFYPPIIKKGGKSRDLPMVNKELREALHRYLDLRVSSDPNIKPSSPLFLSQKKGPYTPQALQEHMALMLRGWAGIEKASSHSGRRTVITNVLKNSSIKVAQKIAGHVDASTTIIYDQPGEQDLAKSLGSI